MWPDRVRGICFGGDYNPEQWPEEVWAQDVRLMQEAGVSLVSVGIFSWAMLEPAEGKYEFGWLDRVMDMLAEGGVAVDLATATASPPPWFSRLYPETLPARRDGRRLWPGARQAYCPSSPVYRERATALAEALATRYHGHEALAMWHVGNEYGCHVAQCFCDVSAAAFREWLRTRYGDVDDLNDAWGTAFWSQRYSDWEEVLPPRLTPTFANPTQRLDYRRFSSDELLDCFRSERDVLHRVSPGVPVTTNFMVHRDAVDCWAWAREVDLVSNDHYLVGTDPQPHIDLSMCADLTRGLASGRPWLLMEHSTSAVNWQPRNLAKLPGQLRRNSLQHLARGADGVMFFQWRASRAGAEKFHSGMVPHGGQDTKVWREVVELGDTLRRCEELRGSTVRAEVAVLFDWEAWWACELDAHPSVDVTYRERVRALYRALWDAGVTVDFVHPEADLSRYRLVVVPSLYLVTDATAENVTGYVAAGGHVLATYFSGIVDGNDHIRLGGYPGAFRDMLGVRVEEFFPLRARQKVRLDSGANATVWAELVHPTGAEVIASYVDGPLPGVPAVTRNAYGEGIAWYLATELGRGAAARLIRKVLAVADVTAPADAPPGVEVVRRVGDEHAYLLVLNHTGSAVQLQAHGLDLVSEAPVDGGLELEAGGVAVVREGTGGAP
ncbi:MAG: beta-galactosidase [Streptomycetales bacterium]